jgi:hypothetical protein
MEKHLYIFGYCTPEQFSANEKHGWDDEDSASVFIEAPTAEQALAWGITISESFIQWLFKDSTVSWTAMNFAHWIEENPAERYEPIHLSHIQTVRLGELPDLPELFVPKYLKNKE